jgi:hypothetical protein
MAGEDLELPFQGLASVNEECGLVMNAILVGRHCENGIVCAPKCAQWIDSPNFLPVPLIGFTKLEKSSNYG